MTLAVVQLLSLLVWLKAYPGYVVFRTHQDHPGTREKCFQSAAF